MSSKPRLFSSIKIREVNLKNRIVVSPMCMYSSSDGMANNWHLVHLGSRAVGGAGLVFSEATAISPEARITPYDLGIWKDSHIEKLKEITSFITAQGSVPGIQLAHAGRKASTARPWEGGQYIPDTEGGWNTLGPSAVPFTPGQPLPEMLDTEGLQKVVEDFRQAAERALKAGFKVAEIHAAHGYLLHQFLSPLSNKREDQYGGSFENRIRILMQVLEAVQEAWPENLPIFVRISATDWVAGGWNEDDSIMLAKLLRERGADLIDCSSGGLVPHAEIPVQKGYQIGFSENIRSQAGILTGAVGLITEPEEAEEILQKDQADLVLLAREFLRNPYFALDAGRQLEADISWPNQYSRAKI